MSIQQKILSLVESEKDCRVRLIEVREYNRGVHHAAAVVEEADAILSELAKALDDLHKFGSDPSVNESRWAEMHASSALKRYKQFKESCHE